MEASKIHFIVDHKHRDFPSLSLIGFLLQEQGHKVSYEAIPTVSVRSIIQSGADFVVVPNELFRPKMVEELQRQGRKIIMIRTEGTTKDRCAKHKVLSRPDLMFYWNRSEFEKYAHELDGHGVQTEVKGCPRLDFSHPNLNGLLEPPEAVRHRYQLVDDKKTITIATSTQAAFWSADELQDFYKTWKQLAVAGSSPIDNHEEAIGLKHLATQTIDYIRDRYPDIQIAIKPHPNESILYWQKFVEDRQGGGLVLVVGDNINTFLQVSDLHIGTGVCTTTFEAKLTGLVAGQLHVGLTEKWMDDRHLELPDFTIKDVNTIDEVLAKYLFNEDSSRGKTIDDYIARFYYKHDGLRCYDHAVTIGHYIGSTQINTLRSKLGRQFRIMQYECRMVQAPPGLGRIARNWRRLSMILRIIVVHGLNFLHFPANNSGSILPSARKQVKGGVDKRGRFDNRINSGDETMWYELFLSNGLGNKNFHKATRVEERLRASSTEIGAKV